MKEPKPDPSNDNAASAKARPLWPKLLTAIVLLGVGAIAISLLPRGYSQDITLIGKGSRVIVLLQEPFTVDSQQNVDAMNALRAEYESRVKLIVADRKVEQGKKFSAQYGIDTTAFVLFAPNGDKLAVIYGQQSVPELRKKIDSAFQF